MSDNTLSLSSGARFVKKQKSLGLCKCGIQLVEGKSRCKYCLADIRERSAYTRKVKLLTNVCTMSGCNNTPLDNRKMCASCLLKSKYYTLKANYGLTKELYEQLITNQNNVCAICKLEFSGSSHGTTVMVDHNHSTGKIRGLLCHNCNIMIGNSKDNIELLQRAIDYLKEDK